MALRFSLLAASLLAASLLAVALAPRAQTVTLDDAYTSTLTPGAIDVQLVSASLDGKGRALLLTTAARQALRLERLDVLGGPDPSFPQRDLTPAFPFGSSEFSGAVTGFGGDSIAIAGTSRPASGSTTHLPFIGRFGEDGSPAAGYGPTGIRAVSLPLPSEIRALRVDGARTYLAAEHRSTGQCLVAAVQVGGELDPTFGTGGIVRLTAPGDCRARDLLVIGETVYLLAARPGASGFAVGSVWALRADGSAAAFGQGGRADVALPGESLVATTLAEWNGKVAVGGFTETQDAQRLVVAVLTRAGAPDASFGTAGTDASAGPLQTAGYFQSRVGLAAIDGALVATAAGQIGTTPTPDVPVRYGLLTEIWGFGGNRVAQQSGPNGFGFVTVASGFPGRQPAYRGVWADATQQGRLVVAGQQVVSGSNIEAARVVRLRLDGFGTAADGVAPEAAQALRVSPNPATAAARVALTLSEAATARVVVIDALGRAVAVLADGPLPAGETALRLDAARLPTGVYAVVATVGSEQTVRRVTVVR